MHPVKSCPWRWDAWSAHDAGTGGDPLLAAPILAEGADELADPNRWQLGRR